MATPSVRLPGAIVTLSDEHRYMHLLLDTLDEHLQDADFSKETDYFLIQDIVTYLHEYPDTVHHPTEDLLFEKLLHRNPASSRQVARLRRDHDRLSEDTATILELIDDASKRPSPQAAEGLRIAAGTYTDRLRRHMRFEEAELFPSAVRCLAHKDWQAIEASLGAVEDPLFGAAVARNYRPLYEFFAARTTNLSRRATGFGFLQLDSMIASADALESGVVEMLDMLFRRAESLLREVRNTRATTFAERGLCGTLLVPARLLAFAGRQGFDTAREAAGISLRTFKGAAEPLWKRPS